MSISERIRVRRDALGYTKKEVADAVGVSESTYLRWESGDIKAMGIDKVESLAKALKCSPAYIMGWVDIDTKYQLIELYDQATAEEKKEILSFIEFKVKKITQCDIVAHKGGPLWPNEEQAGSPTGMAL